MPNIAERREELIKLGIEGKTKLSEVAEEWRCSTENIVGHLHTIQESKNYAFLVDGQGYFRIFGDLKAR